MQIEHTDCIDTGGGAARKAPPDPWAMVPASGCLLFLRRWAAAQRTEVADARFPSEPAFPRASVR